MAQPPFPRLNDIITDLDACTLEEAIVEILQKTVGRDPELNVDEIVRSVLAREQMHSTVLDNGVALPHAHCPAIERPQVLIGRSRKGLSSPQEKTPVHLVFLLLGNSTSTFQILTQIRPALDNAATREALMEAESAAQMLKLLEQHPADKKPESQEEPPGSRPESLWKRLLANPVIGDFVFFLRQLAITVTLSKKLLLIAISSGIVGGVGAIMFNFCIDSSMHIFEGLAGIMPHPWLVALVPALGGVLCGLIKQYGGLPFDVPCATDGYVECVQHDGKVKPKTPFLLILAASITIGSGGSCGRECPTAYIGSGLGAIATRCLQFLRLDKLLGVKLGRRDFRLLAICGASAGLAAIFRAPIGGAIFVCEVLYEHGMEVKSIIPAIFSGAISYIVFSSVYGFEALYQMDAVWQFGVYNLIFAISAGIASAAVGWFYVRFFYKIFHIARASTLPDWTKPAIGGLLQGMMVVFVAKELWGLGYSGIQEAVNGHFGMWTLLLLCFGKIISTAFTVASGGSGGVLAPSLFIGAMLGGFLGKVFELWSPSGTPAGVYVVIGMAALFSAVGKVPLSLPILLMEATRNFSVILPVFVGSAVGYALSGPFKIYESQEPYPQAAMGGGFNALGETEGDLLAPYPVSAAMARTLDVIDEETPISGILKKFTESDHLFFPVRSADGHYCGTIALEQIRPLLLDQEADHFIVARDVADTGYPTVSANESLGEVLQFFNQEGVRYLPVVDNDNLLVGLLDKREVQRLLKRQILQRTAGVEYMGSSPWKTGVEDKQPPETY